MNVAIIGAGLAGLAAAHKLRSARPDIRIIIFEKSRGVGGRAATRRAHGATFDHGAQYIKTPTPELESLLHALPHETLVDIARPVWTFSGTNVISAGDPTQNADPKWTYSDGITRLAKELARDLDIRFESRITRLTYANDSYTLFDESGTPLFTADAVLLTPPAPQTHALIAASELPHDSQDALLTELGLATYRPCLTLTLGYPPLLRERPFYALVNTDRQHPISWLAYEHLKPKRESGGQHVLIAQMAPGWSSAHWDDPLESVAQQVAGLASALLDEALPTPQWADRQGWRYALPDSGADATRLNATLPGLYFAGDYTAGQGRVHLAIQQGRHIAERLEQINSD